MTTGCCRTRFGPYFPRKYDPLIAGSGEEAVRLLTEKPVDLVLLDIRLPGMDGIERLQKISYRLDLLVIMMTAFEDIKPLSPP